MPKKKKQLTPAEKISQIIFTKLSALSLLIVVIAIIVNIAIAQFSYNDQGQPSNVSIAKWIQNNPKAIIESVQKMQMEEAKKIQEERDKIQEERDKIVKEKIPARMDDLISDSLDGTYSSNDKPDVNIIEFFDYNCVYCKRVGETVNKLKSKKNIRIVYKEYPILGSSSEDLARVAIAVNIISPSKYSLFHHKLMKSKARTTEEAIKIAVDIGINVVNLKTTLKKDEKKINNKIQKNRELAQDLRITGTPGFIIGKQLIPGAVGLEELKEAIKKARSEK